LRIVLVRPPSSLTPMGDSAAQHHPVGLALLCAVAERAGHTAEIVDYEVMPLNAGRILSLGPDVVGITAMTATVGMAYRIGARLKRVRPDLPVILGGVHATVIPEVCLAQAGDSIDALVLGEGEERLPIVLARIGSGEGFQGLEGVAWKEAGTVRIDPPRGFIEDLDTLPFPDRTKIRMELYRQASSPGFSRTFLRITEIFTSRGCPYHCVFCSAGVLSGRRTRFRSPENVAEEMRLCIGRFGIQHFTINDDNFIAETSRTEEFCRRVAPLQVTWSCETRVNSATLDLLTSLRKAGCRKVSFGVESGSPRILEKIRKGITIRMVEDAFRHGRRAGLLRSGFFQVGAHPEETREDLRLTWQLVRRIDPDFLIVSIATPFPGTELYRQMKDRGLILDEDWSNYTHFTPCPSWRTLHFSPTQLVSLQRTMLRRFYLRPGTLFKRLAATRSLGQLLYQISAGISILRMPHTRPVRGKPEP